MIGTRSGKALMMTAALLVSGATIVNCSKKTTQEDLGNITLALTLSPGVIINTVTYAISGNGYTGNGTIDVSGSTTPTATAFVSGIPAGNNYLVTMHAVSTNGTTTCDGQTTFNVATGQTAMANVILQCVGPGVGMVGQVAINGRLDNCPYITGLSASSLTTAVGASINIGVTATDLDGDPITFAWTGGAGVGTILAAGSANTSFRCTAAGTTQLSVSITDGVCGDTRMNGIPVTCTGAGTAGAGGGTAGTGGATAGTGGGTAGTGGGTAGTGGATAGTGGGATAGTGGGTAGTGGGTAGTGGTTPPMCMETVSGGASCGSCTTDNCALAAAPDGDSGCCALTVPGDVALCQAVSACFGTNAPTCTAGGDPTRCFCGTSGGACFASAGAANGPCTAQVIAAAKTSDPAMIRAQFTSVNSPLGRATNLTACRGSFCSAECTVP